MESLGFKGSILRGLLFGFLFTTPLYIGFAIIGLFRVGKLGFFWAALLPAVLFGLFHIYQGHDLMSSLAAFGVTMLGSFFFSWMFVAWDYNLMVPISLHFFMNLAWGLFIVEGTGNAAGGLASNILRAVCLIFAIMFTVIYDKRNNKDALKFPVFKL